MSGAPQMPQGHMGQSMGMRLPMQGGMNNGPVSAGQPFNAPMPTPNTMAYRGGMPNIPGMQGLPPFQGNIPSQPSTGQFLQQQQQQQIQQQQIQQQNAQQYPQGNSIESQGGGG